MLSLSLIQQPLDIWIFKFKFFYQLRLKNNKKNQFFNCTSQISSALQPHMGFTGGSDSKESAYNVGDLGSISGLGRFPGEGKGYPRQYSVLEKSMGCKELDRTERLLLSQPHVINGMCIGKCKLGPAIITGSFMGSCCSDIFMSSFIIVIGVQYILQVINLT